MLISYQSKQKNVLGVVDPCVDTISDITQEKKSIYLYGLFYYDLKLMFKENTTFVFFIIELLIV